MEEQNMSESSMPSTVSTKLIVVLVVIIVLGGIYAWARKGGEESGQVNEGASVKQEQTMAPEAEAPNPEPPAATETPPTSSAVPAPGVPPESVQEKVVVPAGVVTITYTDAGYSPQTVTVKKGATVTFQNESAAATWPASAVHPTHVAYPTTGGCIGSTFDACRGLKTAETWSFQFNEVGTWKYHNHLNPTKFGSITVTE